jgi:hypothetical protein
VKLKPGNPIEGRDLSEELQCTRCASELSRWCGGRSGVVVSFKRLNLN